MKHLTYQEMKQLKTLNLQRKIITLTTYWNKKTIFALNLMKFISLHPILHYILFEDHPTFFTSIFPLKNARERESNCESNFGVPQP